jgi:hypothetical protein
MLRLLLLSVTAPRECISDVGFSPYRVDPVAARRGVCVTDKKRMVDGEAEASG